MLTIGLTGGIGSGKSTVAKLFSDQGITVIDTDQIARDVISPGNDVLNTIVEEFGPAILLPNNTLDRAKLREIIFRDAVKRTFLEKLLHPLIRSELKRQIDLARSPYCIAVIPLLFETAPNPLVDRILVVDAAEELQLQRAEQRDRLSKDAIVAIMRSQVTRDVRLAGADDIIYNDGKLEDVMPQVEKLHRYYLSIC